MKILRICRQSGDATVFENKEHLRTSLIDLHEDEIVSDEKFTPKMLQEHKSSTLDQLCSMFDWSYKQITNKEAKLTRL